MRLMKQLVVLSYQTRKLAAYGGLLLALRVLRGDDFPKLSAKKKILKIGLKLTELESKYTMNANP